MVIRPHAKRHGSPVALQGRSRAAHGGRVGRYRRIGWQCVSFSNRRRAVFRTTTSRERQSERGKNHDSSIAQYTAANVRSQSRRDSPSHGGDPQNLERERAFAPVQLQTDHLDAPAFGKLRVPGSARSRKQHHVLERHRAAALATAISTESMPRRWCHRGTACERRARWIHRPTKTTRFR